MADRKRRFFLWMVSNWDAITAGGKIVFTATGGAVSGYFAFITDALRIYAPFSWIAATFLGALVAATILAAWNWFRAERIRALYLREASRDSIEFNPLEDQIIRRRIHISDLISPSGEPTTNKTFINCEIVGPGAVFFGTLNAHNPRLSGCEAIRMTTNTVHSIPNKAIFVDCIFRDCAFINLVLLMPENKYDQMKTAFGEVVKWI